jgi:phosphoribosylaminoimidazole carboxylase (NCAIR synthetase)
LLHEKHCIDGSVASQLELHLKQIRILLCPEPYKHPKTTKLNLNTTKEKGDGNKLSSHISLEHHHKEKQQCITTSSFFFSSSSSK